MAWEWARLCRRRAARRQPGRAGRGRSRGGRGRGARARRGWRSRTALLGAAFGAVDSARAQGDARPYGGPRRALGRAALRLLLWLARHGRGRRGPLAVASRGRVGDRYRRLRVRAGSFGGPRLAPRWSPRKTWAGLVGGTVCAALVGLATAVGSDRAGVPLVLRQRGACDCRAVRRSCGIRWQSEGSA